MEKRILIVTDLSKKAWNALNYAIGLYREYKCSFLLLNSKFLENSTEREATENAQKNSNKQLKKLVSDSISGKDHYNHNFQLISSSNNVPEAIKEVNLKHKIDLIVMGTTGSKGSLDSSLEMNQFEIIDKIPEMPVLLVPENSTLPEGVLREILFAVDYNDGILYNSLEPLLEIASQYKAVIRILDVNTKNPDEEREKNKQHLENCFTNFLHTYHSLQNEKPVPGIHSYIESRGSNLLAVSNKDEKFLSALFSEDGRPVIPVLVLR